MTKALDGLIGRLKNIKNISNKTMDTKNYKEKYENAIKIAKQNPNAFVKDVVDKIFPELKESEDERIRGRLINLVKMSNEVGGFALHKWEADEMIAWLEKQGEQKPEWSEEDETGWTNTMIMIKECASNHYTKDSIKLVVDWLTSLKDRVVPQPQWSDEDEEIHRKCICAMRASACGFPEEEKFVEQVDNWLKSLKDRIQSKQEWSELKEKKQ